MSYAFDEFVLDTRLFQLRRDGQAIPLEPKVFDVLRYLVEHADRVVTKRELLDALWPGEVVTEAVLPTNINALRRALGQERGARAPIETVHGRGYRFTSQVARSAPLPSEPPAEHDLPSQPSLGPEGDGDGPFVGQQAVLSRLKRAVVRALAGQGQICVLRGEAGIGKTRIAHHVVQLMRTYGADAWIGSCPEGLGTPPLWIWQEVLRSARAVEGVPSLRRLLGAGTDASPLMAAWLDEHDHAFQALSERERFRVHDALVRLLSAAARVRPKVIWLEDLHRADDASWQVLRLLAPHLEHLPVLVLCTVRSRDDLTVALPVQRHVDDLGRLSYCQRIHVPPLEADDTRTLVSALLDAPPSEELCALVHQKSSGNPLFIREIVDACAAQGQLDDLRALRGMAPPDAIRHVLARRVERLGESEARALESMSVVGHDVDVGLAAELAELPVEALYGVLERAESARILVRVPERVAAYRFVHSLLRETLYTDLERVRRRKLHLCAADWLAARARSGSSELAREIAHHRVQALPLGDMAQTAHWLHLAGDECTRAGALVEALRSYRAALEVGRNLGGLPEHESGELERAVARTERALRDERASLS